MKKIVYCDLNAFCVADQICNAICRLNCILFLRWFHIWKEIGNYICSVDCWGLAKPPSEGWKGSHAMIIPFDHYNDVIGSTKASQITSTWIVCSTVCSGTDKKKTTSKLRVTDLCEGNPPVTGGFPSQRASNTENVSIWWRHHYKDVIDYQRTYIRIMYDRSIHSCGGWLPLFT